LGIGPFVIAGLKAELPAYFARSNGVNPPDICEWWKNDETLLPNWAGAAKKALPVQPSFAASERVFSLLNNTFGKRQNSSLEDYVEYCKCCSIIVAIFGQNNGHNRGKIVAMPKSVIRPTQITIDYLACLCGLCADARFCPSCKP